jgi:hypothetical protein
MVAFANRPPTRKRPFSSQKGRNRTSTLFPATCALLDLSSFISFWKCLPCIILIKAQSAYSNSFTSSCPTTLLRLFNPLFNQRKQYAVIRIICFNDEWFVSNGKSDDNVHTKLYVFDVTFLSSGIFSISDLSTFVSFGHISASLANHSGPYHQIDFLPMSSALHPREITSAALS